MLFFKGRNLNIYKQKKRLTSANNPYFQVFDKIRFYKDAIAFCLI